MSVDSSEPHLKVKYQHGVQFRRNRRLGGRCTALLWMSVDFCGCGEAKIHQYWVQGVASSNPAAPTNGIKQLGHSSEWPFCFLYSGSKLDAGNPVQRTSAFSENRPMNISATGQA